MKKYFKDWSNLLSFSLALIPAFCLYFLPPGAAVPYLIFAITFLCALILLWLNIKQFLDAQEIHPVSIEFLRCINNRILCKPNNLISHNSIVSFYELADGFEKLIAYGYVESINSKGLAQIILFDSCAKSMDYLATHCQTNNIRKCTGRNKKHNNKEVIYVFQNCQGAQRP